MLLTLFRACDALPASCKFHITTGRVTLDPRRMHYRTTGHMTLEARHYESLQNRAYDATSASHLILSRKFFHIFIIDAIFSKNWWWWLVLKFDWQQTVCNEISQVTGIYQKLICGTFILGFYHVVCYIYTHLWTCLYMGVCVYVKRSDILRNERIKRKEKNESLPVILGR